MERTAPARTGDTQTRPVLFPLALAAALALPACPAAPLPEDPYVAEVTRAARAERADRHAEAAEAYAQAATLTQDEAVARTALYRAAQETERAGDVEPALAMYTDLADRFPGTPEAGRGLYDAARLCRTLGRDDDAIALWLRLIRQEPQCALSDMAVRRLYQTHADREDLAAFDALVTAELATALERPPDLLAALYLFRARARGDLDRPRESYADIDAGLAGCAYPSCCYWDDLPWLGAEIASDAGDYRRAIEWLDRLLQWKEESWFTGSYYSTYYDNAQRWKAEILRDDLGEPAEAAEAFLELENFTDSMLRDDGLYEAARLFLERLDEPSRGCAALRELLDEFPDSNRRREAEELLARCG
ncbi:MAG: tetratricopeptide repeat protein [Deltaproteobacteria bacterium]|nr:tetratricopeptide repeat protein [Deltaproteobacteria bacterium]